MVPWWDNHREFGIEHIRDFWNATSNSHDALVQYGLEVYNLAQTFDMASGLQFLYFFCISFSLYLFNYG